MTATPGYRAAPAAPAYTPPNLAGLPPAAAPTARRRPMLFLLGAALIAVGGLAGYYAVSQQGHRVAVLAVTRTVPFGQQLTAADLAIAHISADPALSPVPVGQESHLLGRPATATLYPGEVLVASDVASASVVPPGDQVVFVPLADDRVTASGLSPQQPVTLVYAPTTAAAGNAAASGASPGPSTGSGAPSSITGTVLSVAAPTTDGTIVVTVIVPSGQAATVATWAQTGAVELTAS